jgi:3-hydroxybutyryl-CoA dehydrogenase
MAATKKKKSSDKKKPLAGKLKKIQRKSLRNAIAPAAAPTSTAVAVLSPDLGVKALEPERILVIGEEPLVSEYAALFAAKHIAFTTTLDKSCSISFAFELTNVDTAAKRENLKRLDLSLPPSTIILSSSVTISATEQATWIEHRERLVGIGAMPTLSTRPLLEIAPTIFSPAPIVEHALTFFVRLEKQGEIVQDRVGLVFPRIICRLINEAAFALSEEIAVPQDIDAAIKFGLNHPRGPIEWVDRLGLAQVAAVLNALERESGDPRYRIAPLLRQMALAGEWWRR